jgi:endoglucanase
MRFKLILNWRTLTFCIATMVASFAVHAQYLHQQGKYIVDGNGNEVILRGMGLGGWMLQEGYMLETNAFANPQHQIRSRIVEVIGEENTKEFYNRWLANHCTRRDIDSLAAWGFNSVRLPMHYNLYTLPIEQEPVAGQNTWLETGFVLTDSLVKWCAANSMYVILDLHAAPGGQGKDAAISDYDNTKPSLWESEANKQKTIALWKKLAERYATHPWVGGYDLINETNWAFTGTNQNGCDESSNAPLRKLLMDITTAIREVDQNHMIFIEGNCWANNYNGILPPWDNNMVVSFHKYWNYNDQGSIQGFINIRDQHNVPLWLGESGENSNVWFRNAIALLEKNKIGWSWWPMKKVGSVVNPLTIVRNEGYKDLLDYWQGTKPKPGVETAKASLFELADNLKIEKCLYRPDVIDAMFRQVNDPATRPFKTHILPGVIQASDYDLGVYNKAYSDTDTATYHVSGGSYTAWNNGWSYRNDGVDIQSITDTSPESNGYAVGWTATGEWTTYTVSVDSSASYSMEIRYATPSLAKIKISSGGIDRSGIVNLAQTGGYNNYNSATVSNVVLYKGTQQIRIFHEQGGANVSFLKFSLEKKITEIPFTYVSAETFKEGSEVSLTLNKKIDEASVVAHGFSATINSQVATISSVALQANFTALTITLDKELKETDVIVLSYNGDAIAATDASLLDDFANIAVKNNITFHHPVPGLIEAEAFTKNVGLQLETTGDVGGGSNIGYTHNGDYLEYLIRVPDAGTYTVEARVACNATAGRIQLQQISKTGQVLNTSFLDVPVTGGWQTWQTVKSTMKLDEGPSVLKLIVIQPEFNLNWIKFSGGVINGIKRNRQGSLHIYPNPVRDHLKIELPEESFRENNSLTIRNLMGNICNHRQGSSHGELQRVYVGDLPAGLYIIELQIGQRYWNNRFVVR